MLHLSIELYITYPSLYSKCFAPYLVSYFSFCTDYYFACLYMSNCDRLARRNNSCVQGPRHCSHVPKSMSPLRSESKNKGQHGERLTWHPNTIIKVCSDTSAMFFFFWLFAVWYEFCVQLFPSIKVENRSYGSTKDWFENLKHLVKSPLHLLGYRCKGGICLNWIMDHDLSFNFWPKTRRLWWQSSLKTLKVHLSMESAQNDEILKFHF